MNDDAAMSKKTMEFCWHFSETKSNKILKKKTPKSKKISQTLFSKIISRHVSIIWGIIDRTY